MKEINKIIFIICLLLIVWSTSSCTNEQFSVSDGASDQPARLAVTLSSKAAGEIVEDGDNTKNENKILSARIIVIGAEGSYWNGKVTCNETFEVKVADQILNAQTRAGNSNIYVVANETSQLGKILSNVKTADEFNAAILEFIPLEATQTYETLPMMAHLTVKLTAESEANNITAKLERLYAKIRIKLKAGVDEKGESYDGKVTLSSVQLMSIPQYSHLAKAQEYTSDEMINGTIVNQTELITAATTTKPIELYAPEYLVSDPKLHSYLIVKGVLTGTNASCIYRIALGDDTKTEIPNYKIARNTIYDITGTIKGYGALDVDVEMIVSKWNVVKTGEVVGEYCNVKSIKINDVQLSKGQELDYNAATITVECSASEAGLVATLMSGETQLSSVTTTVAGLNTVSLDLPVNFAAEGIRTGDRRPITIKISHPKLKKIHYDNTVQSEINIDHVQKVAIWADTNLGAKSVTGVGCFFQYARNNAFAESGDVNTVIGPLTWEDATETYKSYYITAANNSTSWCSSGFKNLWETTENPCNNIYGPIWKLPTKTDMEELTKLIQNNSGWDQLDGKDGKYFGIGDNRVFFAKGTYREWGGGVVSLDPYSTNWFSSTLVDGQCCTMSYVNGAATVNVSTQAITTYGFNIRCIQVK